jgi:hypothetical protein
MTVEFVVAPLLTRKKFNDLTGKEYSYLTVDSFAGALPMSNGKKQSHWNCVCRCGIRISAIPHGRLTSGNSESCGCLFLERVTHHNMGKTAEYKAWGTMIQRCTNDRNPAWKNYGGRGIAVCDEWLKSFISFFEYVGPKPTPKHSLDRFPDVNGNYEPGNVRWATSKEQSRNRRGTRLISFNGERKCITDWAEIVGISCGVIWGRLDSGWSVEMAFTAPVKKKKEKQ